MFSTLNIDQLNQFSKNKKIIFFGRSDDLITKTKKIFKKKVSFIVDNNKNLKNQKYINLDIFNPKILYNLDFSKYYIIITATDCLGIARFLKNEIKLQNLKNFCISPVMNDWVKLSAIKNYDKNIMFSCHDFRDPKYGLRHSKGGGGIYIMNTKNNNYFKILKGQFRCITEYKKNIYIAVEQFKGLIIFFNLKGEILKKINIRNSKLEKNLSANNCGLAVDKRKKLIYVSDTFTDQIYVVSIKLKKVIKKINFSTLFKESKSYHHINDICLNGNSLYVSYFSKTGRWKKNIFDGGVTKINLINNKRKVIINNLTKPHSIKFLEKKYIICNSVKGELILNGKIIGNFPGFLRGVDFDKNYFYLGQSETLYMTLFKLKYKNIMNNAGIYLFDIKTKASRFLATPSIMNIHDIKVI